MRARFLMLTVAVCVFGAATVAAQTVTLTLESTQNGQTVAPGATIDWTIKVLVSDGDNDGLALVCCDLTQAAGNPAKLDIPPASGVPTGMEKFSRPLGVTNPPETDPVTGYMGVQRGTAGEMNLIQIGGGQNTFGEAMSPGTGIAENADVSAGVAQGGTPQVVATGSFLAPATTGSYTFSIENLFGNVLVQRNDPPAFSPVVKITPTAAPSSFSFTVGAGYQIGDLNCDGLVNNGDIDPFVLAVTDEAGYNAQYPSCDRNLADCNQDSLINNGDIDSFVALIAG